MKKYDKGIGNWKGRINQWARNNRHSIRRPSTAQRQKKRVFYLLWGHILQIIACFLVGALLAFGFTYFFVTPMYQASASIYIVSASNNSIVNLTDLQIGSQLTADYQELMLSRPLLQDVIKDLDLDTNYRSLAGQVSITNANDTRILKVTVTDSDPERAADIANELIKQARIYLPEIDGDGDAQRGGGRCGAHPEVQPQLRQEHGAGRTAGRCSLLRRAAGAVPDEGQLRYAGRCGQVSGRPAAGYHPGGRSGQLQPQ
ncbi:MAG: Wzz/FepE/Etk N-terminal domain-containing protein [Faecalibacterium sp.]